MLAQAEGTSEFKGLEEGEKFKQRLLYSILFRLVSEITAVLVIYETKKEFGQCLSGLVIGKKWV